jgi:Flp pilus assembly pilin Flp
MALLQHPHAPGKRASRIETRRARRFDGRRPGLGAGAEMRDLMRTAWRYTAGQDATEYVLLLVLIALAISGGVVLVSSGINEA